MSNFKSRLNKLRAKTHGFVSYQTLCLTRDYFKALVDEEDKPENFEEKFQEYSALIDEYAKTEDKKFLEKADSISNVIKAVTSKQMYELTLDLCERYPDGIWMYKDDDDFYAGAEKAAKRYFESKRIKQSITSF